MERLFRSLKSELVPAIGCSNFEKAREGVNEYIIGYYSTLSRTHNDGLPPNTTEKNYWNAKKAVAKNHLTNRFRKSVESTAIFVQQLRII